MNNSTRSTLRTLVVVATLLALAGPAVAGVAADAPEQSPTGSDAADAPEQAPTGSDAADAPEQAPTGSDAGTAEQANWGDTVDTAGQVSWGDAGSDLRNATGVGESTASAGNVTVALSPSESTVPPGENQSYDVVVDGAAGGIAAYELDLTVADPAVGGFVAYDPVNEPFLYNATISAEGAALDAMVALGDNKHGPGETVTVATVTLGAGAAASTGSTGVLVEGAAVMDNENLFYSVAGVENATLGVNPNAVGIDPRPAGDQRLVGSPFDVDVAVEHPTSGISAFDIQVELLGNGTVLGYSLPQNGTDDTQVADDGSLISLDVDLSEPYEPGEEQVVATVTVAGTAPGTLEVASTGATVTDSGGDTYASGFGSASVTLLEGPPPLPDSDQRPQDLTGDLLVEDTDGDGTFDIFDVQALFANLDSDPVQNHPDAFNFNGDFDPSKVTIFDVQALFSRLL
jgi:hypothetical protein